MSRTAVNFILDTLLLLVTMSVLLISAILRFVFPAPTMAGGWTLWGRDYNAWSSFQFVLISIVGFSVLIHIMLHWSWICGVIVTKLIRRPARQAQTDDGSKTLWGVGMLIVIVNILGALLAIAYVMIEGPAGP